MKTTILINLLLITSFISYAQRSKKPWKNGRDRESNYYNYIPKSLNLKTIKEELKGINYNKSSNNAKPIYDRNTQAVISKANGINIAWINYGRDIGVNPNGGKNFRPDLKKFEEVMNFVSSNGGNVIRWWYHTNGSTNPVFDRQQKVKRNPNFFHNDVKAILNLAQQKGIKVQICLWSFDMLKDQWEVDAVANKKLLTQKAYRDAYIKNALLPLVNAVGNHPALYAWEVFNEPEGMTRRYANHWPGFLQKIEMKDIQKFINKVSGAIRRAQPKVKITNGSLGFLTNVEDSEKGFWNAYTDVNLINAGGDQKGYLDFYNIHYYNWAGVNGSPFHNNFNTNKIDKPTVIGEFYPDNLELSGVPNIKAKDLGKRLNEKSWHGSIVWSWTDRTSTVARNNMASIISSFSIRDENTLVADAGKNKSYTDFDNDGYEEVTLNGSNSSYTGSPIKSFVWKNKEKVIGQGKRLTTKLPIGSHKLTLIVTNYNGMSETATVTIEIKENIVDSPVVSVKKFEAEKAMILSEVEVKSDEKASNGSFVYMKEKNGKITWGFNVSNTGEYIVDFRYNIPFGRKKQFLNVNTSYIGELTFEGPQNTWQKKRLRLNLKSGFNTITLTANWGYMYVDFISVETEEEVLAKNSNDVNTTISTKITDEEQQKFYIYPVPAKEHITVKGSLIGDKVNIYNTNGILVLKVLLSLDEEIIDVSTLKKGMYIIEVVTKGRKVFIKE